MRGYIALSRVRDVEGLLIVRPFMFGLFSQGPQPWPTLLLRTLQEGWQGEDLHLKCIQTAEQEVEGKQKNALSKRIWRCSKCTTSSTWDAFFKKRGKMDNHWYEEYLQWIIAPNCLRTCRQCRGESQPEEEKIKCVDCKRFQGQAGYSKNTWKNRTTYKRPLCKDCDRRYQCNVCEYHFDKKYFDAKQLDNYKNRKTRLWCNFCKDKSIECGGCKLQKPMTEFSEESASAKISTETLRLCQNCMNISVEERANHHVCQVWASRMENA